MTIRKKEVIIWADLKIKYLLPVALPVVRTVPTLEDYVNSTIIKHELRKE